MEDAGKLDGQVSPGKYYFFSPWLICMAISYGISTTVHAAGTIKCWKNKQKVKECGQVVPPEYAQQRIEILNDRGIVIRVIEPAKSKQQLAEDKRKAKIQAVKDKRRQDDIILLKSFTTERDLIISRDTNINSIKGIIDLANGNANTLKNNLAVLQKKAGDYERSGQKVPPNLIKDIEDVKRQIKENKDYIAQKEKAYTEMVARYKDDLKRYRMLKKVKPR